jgi:diguanylate cyclase (GGDEF)-like protein
VHTGPQRRLEAASGDVASTRLKFDTILIATLITLLLITSVLWDPTGWLLAATQRSGWGVAGRVMFFLATSHVVMFFFGARRGHDLKRELAERRNAQARLRHQADHDDLTGLRNRGSYLRQVSSWLGGTKPVVVALIDLDRFKEINDTLGHNVGDTVLRAAAARMEPLVPPTGVLARLGGDEFAVLLPGEEIETSRRTVRALLDAIREPLETDDLTLEVDASVGMAVSPDHGTRTADLLRCADVAMYAAKAGQRGILEFRADLDDNDQARLGLYGDLKRAVTAGELHLVFQPKVAMDDGRVVGVEALVRWQHPSRGLLAPAAFLSVAEQTGLIRPLTTLVIDQALRACRWWKDLGLTLPVAVNLSPRSLLDNALPARVARLLDVHGLEATGLELEVTESAAMTNPSQALLVLHRIADLGVALSIDDFGTGHASLAYLSRLPVGALKIDRSFVQRLDRDAADRTIVRSTVDLAHDLGLTVVAEGVETDTAWRSLSDWGCDQAQGSLLSRPVSQQEVPARTEDLALYLAASALVPRPRTQATGCDDPRATTR